MLTYRHVNRILGLVGEAKKQLPFDYSLVLYRDYYGKLTSEVLDKADKVFE